MDMVAAPPTLAPRAAVARVTTMLTKSLARSELSQPEAIEASVVE